MIYDSFQCLNELDLLDIHLNAHNDYVDKFIITECPLTHSGKPKPLFYNENKHLFEKFHHKIIHVVLDKFPSNFPTDETFIKDAAHHNMAQLRDTYQRIYHLKVLDFKDDDIIILLDIDEILDLKKLQNLKHDKMYSVTLKNYYYYINNLSSYTFDGSIISKYKYLMDVIKNDNYMHIRRWSKLNKNIINHIEECVGWHFSFLGGSNRIIYKLDSYSHPEYNNQHIKNNILSCLSSNSDIFNRANHNYKLVPLDNSFPEYILKHKDKFSHLIYEIA